MVFSPDGTLIAAEDNFELRLWDVASGQIVRTMDVKINVAELALTPDGKEPVAAPA